MTTTSLYSALVAAKIPVSGRESDLFFDKTAESTKILEQFPQNKQISTCYRSQATGVIIYEVPFAYDPFWDKKMNKK